MSNVDVDVHGKFSKCQAQVLSISCCRWIGHRSFTQLSEDVYMDTVMSLYVTVINIRPSPIYPLHRCGIFLKSTCTISIFSLRKCTCLKGLTESLYPQCKTLSGRSI